MSRPVPPTEGFLGMVECEWPVYFYTEEDLALSFLEKATPIKRRFLWRVRVELGEELVLVRSRARLVPPPQVEE